MPRGRGFRGYTSCQVSQVQDVQQESASRRRSSWFGPIADGPGSVPRAPEISASGCLVCDNALTVSWRPASEANSMEDGPADGPAEHYELEYRKTNGSSTVTAAGGACWEKIQEIRDTQVTVSGRRRSPLLSLAC